MLIPTLCVLITLTAGLHFGGRFAEAGGYRQGRLAAALTQALLSALMVYLSLFLSESSDLLLWLGVAAGSLLGFALGMVVHAANARERAGADTPLLSASGD